MKGALTQHASTHWVGHAQPWSTWLRWGLESQWCTGLGLRVLHQHLNRWSRQLTRTAEREMWLPGARGLQRACSGLQRLAAACIFASARRPPAGRHSPATPQPPSDVRHPPVIRNTPSARPPGPRLSLPPARSSCCALVASVSGSVTLYLEARQSSCSKRDRRPPSRRDRRPPPLPPPSSTAAVALAPHLWPDGCHGPRGQQHGDGGHAPDGTTPAKSSGDEPEVPRAPHPLCCQPAHAVSLQSRHETQSADGSSIRGRQRFSIPQ